MHKSLSPSAKYTGLTQHTLKGSRTETFANANDELTHTLDLLLEEMQNCLSKNVVYYMNNTALQNKNVSASRICFLPWCRYDQKDPGQLSLETHLGKKLSSSHLIHLFSCNCFLLSHCLCCNEAWRLLCFSFTYWYL